MQRFVVFFLIFSGNLYFLSLLHVKTERSDMLTVRKEIHTIVAWMQYFLHCPVECALRLFAVVFNLLR